MDKIVGDRKKQLNDMKHILNMQDLLEQYDRENASLNHQVNSLLKQNQKLKDTSLIKKYSLSSIFRNRNGDIGSNMNAFASNRQNQVNKFLKSQNSRKSRYQYLYDENQIKDFKSNLKKQIKRQILKTNQTNLIQKIPSQVGYRKSYENNQFQSVPQSVRFQLTENKQLKMAQVKLSLAQLSLGQQQQQRGPLSIGKVLSKSKSRQKHTQQKELSNSKLYFEDKLDKLDKQDRPGQFMGQKQLESSQLKKYQQVGQQHRQQHPIQPFSQQYHDVLEHSFGKSITHLQLQKKTTLLQSDLPSGLKQANRIDDSRVSNKFIPLSIQSKQLSTNIPMTQQRSTFYNEPFRTESKQKRNHSLHPSPKIQFNYRISQKKVNPFVLHTQQRLQGTLLHELHRNPSQKIKRRFIKIVSNQKINVQQSPKK